MAFFKSHRGAMAVAVVVIALSVLFGFHRSATAARADVEAQFYTGVDGSGYSIANDLEDCLGITANLATVAGRYLDAGALTELEQGREALSASLDRGDISDAHAAYRQLTGAADGVLLALEGCALTQQDADYVQGFRTDLAARADTIARDPYNQTAEEFNSKKLGVFPAVLLRQITFVREAETFR